jgi:hypothetical protein
MKRALVRTVSGAKQGALMTDKRMVAKPITGEYYRFCGDAQGTASQNIVLSAMDMWRYRLFVVSRRRALPSRARAF